MLQITNGTVSRTVKPADYEGRTVTLSFTADPNDDIDAGLATISALAEKHASQRPGAPFARKNPVQEKQDPPTSALVGTAPAETVSNGVVADADPVVITDAELTKAAQAATTRMSGPERTKEVIAKFAGAVGMRIPQVPQEKRAALLAELNALKPGATPASDDY